MDKKVLPPKRHEIFFERTRLISTSAFEEYKNIDKIKWKKLIISFGSLSLLFAFFIFSFLITEFLSVSTNKIVAGVSDQGKKYRIVASKVNSEESISLQPNDRSPASIQKFYFNDSVSNDHLQYDYHEASPDYSTYDDSLAIEEAQEAEDNVAVGEIFEPKCLTRSGSISAGTRVS